jgi:hypothetical protein
MKEKEQCSYCGDLTWTLKKYGRLVHKQLCPNRSMVDDYHQGDLPPLIESSNEQSEIERLKSILQPLAADLAIAEAKIKQLESNNQRLKNEVEELEYHIHNRLLK